MNPQSSLYLRQWVWVYLLSRMAGNPGCFEMFLNLSVLVPEFFLNIFIKKITVWWDLFKSELCGPLFFLKCRFFNVWYNWAVLLHNIGQILLQIVFVSWLLPMSSRTRNILNHYRAPSRCFLKSFSCLDDFCLFSSMYVGQPSTQLIY